MKKVLIVILILILLVLSFFYIKTNKEVTKLDALNIAEIVTGITKSDNEFSVFEKQIYDLGYSESVKEDILSFYKSLETENLYFNFFDIVRNSQMKDYDVVSSEVDTSKVLDITNIREIKYLDLLNYEYFILDDNYIICEVEHLKDKENRIKSPYFRYSYSTCEIVDDFTVKLVMINGVQSKKLNIVLKYDEFKELKNVDFDYEFIK